MRDSILSNYRTELVISVFSLVLGVVAGCFVAAGLDNASYTDLYTYIDGFFNIFKGHNPDLSGIFYESISSNLKYFFAVSLCGLMVIFVPVIPVVIGARGMSIGFTATFMIRAFSNKGIAFCFAGVFMKEIFVLPALLVLSAVSIGIFEKAILKNRIQNITVLSYIVLVFTGIGLIILSACIEAYITPALLRILIK